MSASNIMSSSDNMRILFTDTEIQEKIIEIAKKLSVIYKKNEECENSQKPVALCVLKGAVFFFTDLLRAMNKDFEIDFEIDFIKLSSYGNSSTSSGEVVLSTDTKIDLKGRNVLVIEDIVDSGHSMTFLRKEFKQREVKSLHIVALIDKHERRETDVLVDTIGFSLDKGFIVGYGLDYAERYRALPAIYEIIT